MYAKCFSGFFKFEVVGNLRIKIQKFQLKIITPVLVTPTTSNMEKVRTEKLSISSQRCFQRDELSKLTDFHLTSNLTAHFFEDIDRIILMILYVDTFFISNSFQIWRDYHV